MKVAVYSTKSITLQLLYFRVGGELLGRGDSTIVEVEESAAFADIKGSLNFLTTTPRKKRMTVMSDCFGMRSEGRNGEVK